VSLSDAEDELFFIFLDSRDGGASSRGRLFLDRTCKEEDEEDFFKDRTDEDEEGFFKDRKEEDEEDLFKDFLNSCGVSSSTNIFLFDLDDERWGVDSYDCSSISDRLDSFLVDSGAGDRLLGNTSFEREALVILKTQAKV
jgi:hypothetical protein